MQGPQSKYLGFTSQSWFERVISVLKHLPGEQFTTALSYNQSLSFLCWLWQRGVESTLCLFFKPKFVVVLDCIKSYKSLQKWCIGSRNQTKWSSCLSPNHMIWPFFPQKTPKRWNFISTTTHLSVITHQCIWSSWIILPAHTTNLILYNNTSCEWIIHCMAIFQFMPVSEWFKCVCN